MSTTSALLFGIWIGFTSAVVLALAFGVPALRKRPKLSPPLPALKPERCTCDWWAQTICEACEHQPLPRRIVPLDAGTRSLELDMSGWEWKRKQARDSHGRFI